MFWLSFSECDVSQKLCQAAIHASLNPAGGHATSGYSTLEIITLVGYKGFEKWANLASMHRGEEYERLKKQTLEEMKEHPLKRKLRLYIALLVFVGMIVLMFVAWKNDW